MAATRLAEWQEEIKSAVRGRASVYTNSFALSMHWEYDDTDASDDVASFRAILATLNLRKAEEMVLSGDDTPLAMMIINRIMSAFQAAAAFHGKSIIFIHYAGHEAIRGNELFISEGSTGNELNLSILISQTAAAHWFPGDNMDIVWVLDCCYAHVGTRAPIIRGRIVEIIAATDDGQPIARASPENTLTRKLRTEIAKRKQDGHQFLEIADVTQSIRASSNLVHPSNFLKLGRIFRPTTFQLSQIHQSTRRSTFPTSNSQREHRGKRDAGAI